MIIIGFIGVFFLLRSIVIIFSLFTSAPYVPLEKYLIKESTRFLSLKRGDRFVDIGSGDGRVVFWVAKNYPEVEYCKGIEISLLLNLASRFLRLFSCNKERIVFERRNAFKCDFRKENKVFIYLLKDTVDKLMPVLEKQLPSGAKVVSPLFTIDQKYEKSGDLSVKEVIFRGKIRKIYIWTKK